jgi:hypothetical protein
MLSLALGDAAAEGLVFRLAVETGEGPLRRRHLRALPRQPLCPALLVLGTATCS